MHTNLDRFLFSILVLVAFVAVSKALGAMNRRSVRSRSRKGGLLRKIAGGTPTLLYFWTSDCALCGPQERQIEQARSVIARGGKDLQVRKINASEEDELVRKMNVMTVPTTVMLDGMGKVVAWNPGLREARMLISQFEKAA